MIVSLAAASKLLTANAEAMINAAVENERRAQDVAAPTAQANTAAHSVAAASDEISATIQSITERIVAAQSIASDAMTGAQSACGTIAGGTPRLARGLIPAARMATRPSAIALAKRQR